MKRLALVLVPLVLGSCRDNRASVTVQAICHPKDGSQCAFSGKCDSTLLGTPELDLSMVGAITLFLQVENQLVDNSDKGLGRTNTNDAHVTQMVVAYENYGLSRDVFDVGNQLVPSGGNTVVMAQFPQSVANVTALKSAVTGSFGTLRANIRLRGYFDDGSSFETGDFTTGVYVCDGCIAAAPQPQCPAGKAACPYDGMEPVACGTTTQ
jgi:hypothetical protein